MAHFKFVLLLTSSLVAGVPAAIIMDSLEVVKEEGILVPPPPPAAQPTPAPAPSTPATPPAVVREPTTQLPPVTTPVAGSTLVHCQYRTETWYFRHVSDPRGMHTVTVTVIHPLAGGVELIFRFRPEDNRLYVSLHDEAYVEEFVRRIISPPVK